VLRDVEFMKPVYRHFMRDVASANVGFYSHPDGVEIKGMPGKYWLYVRLTSANGEEYDVALWKILKVAERYPHVLERISKHISFE